MVNFPGRNGRRRRVLNDELLSTSGSRTASIAVAEEDSEYAAPRYSEAAGVEHHPQVTDFIPRRYRSIALLVVAGVVSTAALAAVDRLAPSLAETIGIASPAALDLASPGSIATWIAAVVLLFASIVCVLIYSLRRHRIDDYRGRYRVWLADSAAALLLSANCVAGLHQVLADGLTQLTGSSLLPNGAIWWLGVAGLPLAWLAVRTMFDLIECRLAGTLWIAAVACYAASAVCFLGLVPSFSWIGEAAVYISLTLVGHWLLLAAIVSYARFVVLDAQGLVPIRARARRADTTKPVKHETPRRSGHADNRRTAAESPAESPAAATKDWVDGRRPERESYPDDDEPPAGSTKLSKADRKRLRKLKTQGRAA